MKIFEKYIMKEIAGPFFLGISIFSFIFLTDKIFELVDLIINKGVPINKVMLLVIYIFPSFLAITVPMGVLMSCLMAFGRLSYDNEIIALKSSGINILKISLPALVIAFILSITMVFFNDTILPSSNYAFKTLYFDIIKQRATIIIQEKLFINEFDGYIFYIGEKDDKTSTLKNIIVYTLGSSNSPTHTILAEKGWIFPDSESRRIILRLKNGTINEISEKNLSKYTRITFNNYDIDLNINRVLDSVAKQEKSTREMGVFELYKEIKKIKKENLNNNYYLVEFHKKISIPFACLSFAFIGVPLGIVVKRGGKAIGFGISLALIFVYYLLLVLGEMLGEKGTLNQFFALWIPNLILIIIGIIILIKLSKS